MAAEPSLMKQLGRSFLRACKRRKRKMKIADSSGVKLSGGALLTRTLLLRRLLLRHVISAEEEYVGLLLPPSLAGAVANMALTIDRRVPVNLNYTASAEILNDCISQCGIKHVLTSRRFVEKLGSQFGVDLEKDLDVQLIFLEDVRDLPTWSDKLSCFLTAYLYPTGLLERSLKLHEVDPNDLSTVIFTSGSTGQPKGVMLTQANIAANVEAIETVVQLNENDVIIGALPFFHSFGYTVTLWTAMTLDLQAVYHFSPLDGKQVGKLCKEYSGTLLLATPTFLRTYLRRCTPEEFASLEVVVAGAEKLPKELCDAFEEKFNLRPVEGYGATELAPLASVNVPPSRARKEPGEGMREGSVGRPVPHVSAKITDLDSGEELPTGKPGMLWISGPNVMKGYLNREELTADVIQDGWYKTGDVALLDEDGFIHITGRQSRFSKIGGEMVPHIQIEETLTKIIGGSEEDGLQAAVTAIPDAKKGERLIVIHTAISKTPEELRKGLQESGLPSLYVPSQDSFHEVEELPLLGSGKLDLKGVQQVAKEQFASS